MGPRVVLRIKSVVSYSTLLQVWVIEIMAQTSTTKSSEEIREIMVEVARTQLAAVTAALKFWGGWVESAEKYTQKVSAELTRVSEGTDDSQQFVGRLTDFSREYLREMITLPTTAVDHFASEIEKSPSRLAKRRLRARAKPKRKPKRCQMTPVVRGSGSFLLMMERARTHFR